MRSHLDEPLGVQAARLADATLAFLQRHGSHQISLRAIGERAGLNYWSMSRRGWNPPSLFRAAVSRLTARLERKIAAAPTSAPTVSEAVRRYTAHAAGVVQDADYAQFVRLMISDLGNEPLLAEAYANRIAGPLCEGLDRIVNGAAVSDHLLILLGGTVPRDFLTSLEAEFVFPKLYSGASPLEGAAADAALKRIATTVISQSYAVEISPP